ncbi:hypothetical protein [Demequina sp. NBRC 110054]|uniref:hypothetical protein n=1 Tax=Demequina sp. NBRC 110054 TaxID=1570343 RepID=UPI000A00C9AF|nr:hypothetical protein [Demequina sp. NBRC 110054]
MSLQKIPMPLKLDKAPDPRLAQEVASYHGFHWGPNGIILDHKNGYVAENLTELARLMRDLGWFTGYREPVSAVLHQEIPSKADEVVRELCAKQRRYSGSL